MGYFLISFQSRYMLKVVVEDHDRISDNEHVDTLLTTIHLTSSIIEEPITLRARTQWVYNILTAMATKIDAWKGSRVQQRISLPIFEVPAWFLLFYSDYWSLSNIFSVLQKKYFNADFILFYLSMRKKSLGKRWFFFDSRPIYTHKSQYNTW